MLGSIQDKLLRVRPPRVRITYDVETGGAIEKKELPFIVGIFADLSGDVEEPLPPIKDRKLIDIDRDNFEKVMASIAPRVSIAKINNILPGGQGTLSGAITFHCLDDFAPVAVVKNVPPLRDIYESRGRLRTLQAKAESSDKLQALLDQAVAHDADGKGDALRGELSGAFKDKSLDDWGQAAVSGTLETLLSSECINAETDEQKSAGLKMLGQFYTDIVDPLPADVEKSAAALIDERVASIDKVLGEQLDAIMHAPNFQTVESTWRGMFYLVSRTETGKLLKLRLLNTSKGDLLKDLARAVEFDQSAVFKMIYEAEYGTYGGDPFSMLVGAYEFGRHPQDIELLGKVAEIAASAHAPFITAAYAKLFDLDSFEKLAKPRDLQKIFESLELDGWRSFRESEDSRYVTLTLPRVLLRLPYGADTVPAEGINYEEEVAGENTSKFLWGNSAWILAERITNAFSLYGWTAAIRGVEGGGLIEGLPTYKFKTDRGDIEMVCPTQVSISDRREKELNDLGFMAICHCKGTNKAAFFGGQTTNLPKKYISDLANSNAQISAMLPYILAASRFAHYIKVIMREKIGSFMTRGNVEAFLNTWISQYVLLDDDAAQAIKAAYPLRAAQINVTDIPGKPGSYKATVFLKPHFQLEELTTSIRLVAELPA